jgi:hypothetical protein
MGISIALQKPSIQCPPSGEVKMILMKTKRSLTAFSLIALTTFVAVASGIAGPAPAQGGGDPGGGDRASKLFVRAQLDAPEFLSERMNHQLLDTEALERFGVPDFKDWFARNYAALLMDMSNLKFEWVEQNRNGRCGQTAITNADHSNPPVVYMSLRHCDGYSYEDAIEHLVGESLHHFGLNDAAATSYAALIRKAWERKEVRIKAGVIGVYSDGHRSFAIDPNFNVYFKGHTRKETFSDWKSLGRAYKNGKTISASIEVPCGLFTDKTYEITFEIPNFMYRVDNGLFTSVEVRVIEPTWKFEVCEGKPYRPSSFTFKAQRTSDY